MFINQTWLASLTNAQYMLGVHEGANKHVDAMEKIKTRRPDIHGDTPWGQLILITIKAWAQVIIVIV